MTIPHAPRRDAEGFPELDGESRRLFDALSSADQAEVRRIFRTVVEKSQPYPTRWSADDALGSEVLLLAHIVKWFPSRVRPSTDVA